jgi:hypothetical protein
MQKRINDRMSRLEKKKGERRGGQKQLDEGQYKKERKPRKP